MSIPAIWEGFKRGVGLAVSITMLGGIVLATQVGCDNGTTSGGGNGYENGYDHNGFDKNGNHKDTGTLYDTEGYDRAGFNELGWNRMGINKHTNKPYDPNGYDINGAYYRDKDGYDYKGFDANGYDRNGYNNQGNDKFDVPKEVTAVRDYITPTANRVITQPVASNVVVSMQLDIQDSSNAVGAQFNQYCGNPEFKTIVVNACNAMKNIDNDYPASATVLEIIPEVSKYIAYMVKATPSGERENLKLIMDTLRTRNYAGARDINGTTHVPNTNLYQTELQGLYTELAKTAGNPNSANFDAYVKNTLIPQLSQRLNTSPVLIESLLNNIKTVEGFHANKDDIEAAGFKASTDGMTTGQNIGVRDLTFIRAYLNNALNTLGVNQDVQIGM